MKALYENHKKWVIGVGAILVVVLAAFLTMAILHWTDDDREIVKVAKEKLEEASFKNEELKFVGENKVEYNKDADHYVVTGFVEIYNEYDVDLRSLYVVCVEKSASGYKATKMERYNDSKYEFVDFFTEGYYEGEDLE